MFLTSISLRRALLSASVALLPAVTAHAESSFEILRDNWGVPHVYADETYGLFAGFGYAVAEDRLFQMEMARHSVLGSVASVLGIEHLPYDIETRALYDHRKIRAQIEALPADQRDVLRGYAAGMNKRIAEVQLDPENLMPKQFNDLGFAPKPWTEFDVAMIYTITMAGRFSYYSTELDNAKALARLEKEHGLEKGRALFDEMFWLEDPKAQTTVPEGGQYQMKKAALDLPAGRFDMLRHQTVPGGEDLRPRASNLWILGPNKTDDGSTVLINGPQFGDFNPSYVFSIGLHGAGFDLTGNTPFAVPNVLFGTNGTIAWGATAGPLDVNDFYQLELNPENPTQYRKDGAWADMAARSELFHVKGSPDVSTTVYDSDYGVVQLIDTDTHTAFAMKRSWDGFEIQTLMAWTNMTKTQNYDDWLGQAAKVATTINWYYADKDGNIGYVSPGYLPLRAEGHDQRVPAMADGTMEWQGMRPFADAPKTYNPEQGWIANWNNRSAHGEVANFEANPWGPADRVVELTARINAKEKLSQAEVWGLIRETSFMDVNARYFVPYILKAAESLPADDPRQPMIAALKDWDGKMIRAEDGLATSPAVGLFREWMAVMISDVLQDDSAAVSAVFRQNRISQSPQMLYRALLGDQAGFAQQIDFFNGADQAGRDAIILEALTKAGEHLAKDPENAGPEAWRIELPQHVFSTKNYLGIPQAGEDEGRAISTWMNRGTENNMVVFKDGQASFCAVTPPGQSGFINPKGEASPHYEDQLSLYENFECRPQALLRADVEAVATSKTAYTVE